MAERGFFWIFLRGAVASCASSQLPCFSIVYISFYVLSSPPRPERQPQLQSISSVSSVIFTRHHKLQSHTAYNQPLLGIHVDFHLLLPSLPPPPSPYLLRLCAIYRHTQCEYQVGVSYFEPERCLRALANWVTCEPFRRTAAVDTISWTASPLPASPATTVMNIRILNASPNLYSPLLDVSCWRCALLCLFFTDRVGVFAGSIPGRY